MLVSALKREEFFFSYRAVLRLLQVQAQAMADE
jgi:hypothetical protein